MKFPPLPQFARHAIFAVLFVVLGGVIGYRVAELGGVKNSLANPKTIFHLTGLQQPNEVKDVEFQQFWEVWQTLEQNYLDDDKLQDDKMVYGAIKGMTASLGDPYTFFLEPVEQKRSMEDLQGSFYGIGIQLGYIDQVLAVTTPLKGSPAERAGIHAKDLILHIKDDGKKIDQDTQGWTLEEAVDKIRGDKGSKVTLTLFRKDDLTHKEPFQVTVERDEIVVPSVELKYIDKDGKKYAVITLSRFGERTTDELNKSITDILAQRPAGIVLDMRNNPGGYLEGAIDVASEFVNGGLIVTQQGKFAKKDYTARGTARLASYPLVVTVNGGSASAAEIVAGALRDRREVPLVGEKTFGKGTVQDALRLKNGAGLHVTIARWILPKGDWIHEKGIPVGVEVKDDPATPDDEVIQKAIGEVK
jgi:carboxyl-terminal processing protease